MNQPTSRGVLSSLDNRQPTGSTTTATATTIQSSSNGPSFFVSLNAKTIVPSLSNSSKSDRLPRKIHNLNQLFSQIELLRVRQMDAKLAQIGKKNLNLLGWELESATNDERDLFDPKSIQLLSLDSILIGKSEHLSDANKHMLFNKSFLNCYIESLNLSAHDQKKPLYRKALGKLKHFEQFEQMLNQPSSCLSSSFDTSPTHTSQLSFSPWKQFDLIRAGMKPTSSLHNELMSDASLDNEYLTFEEREESFIASLACLESIDAIDPLKMNYLTPDSTGLVELDPTDLDQVLGKPIEAIKNDLIASLSSNSQSTTTETELDVWASGSSFEL